MSPPSLSFSLPLQSCFVGCPAALQESEEESSEEEADTIEQAERHKLQGNAFFKQERYAQAVRMYTEAIEVSPDSPLRLALSRSVSVALSLSDPAWSGVLLPHR